ncbi:MAG: 4-hydroxy-tetrahydrodipicolinate synthase [Gammaproteobacteria bacterium CG11_big_fil_rev_8_21_14_0_20_46_22]|nr:MAG: 4-hydroxy-tetrahydrodipicolinate synthase [Gammaproteobacteria bacterium CG12_big_fil_rev_8_21_14_0_65_46_12]PIR10759.1 MAG: 4-hydroxy-tetrahydrodipicolinate synthase [Gammaproteobacteria bacterium CG11_big_fil_rev_8_21_14_0_20_46_22]
MTKHFSGSLVALVTPMKDHGEIDEPSFVDLIQWHLAEGTQGLVILGTTGESPTVKAEREALFKLAVKTAAGRVPIIAGVGTNDTKVSIEQAKAAEACGVDAMLVVVPYYNKPPQRGMVEHFKAIHDATQLPIIIYNAFGRTGADIAPETVITLAESCERIVALKDANPELSRVAELKAKLSPDFVLLSGNDDVALEYVLKGGDGVISVTANVVPALMAEMMALANTDVEKAKAINERLNDLHHTLFIESNPIPVKWAVNRMGKIPGGLRLPLVSLAQQNQPLLERVMQSLGVIG